MTGIVRAVRPAEGTVMITHEAIPDLMGSMTMTFRVADPTATRGIAPGDRIQFTLETVDRISASCCSASCRPRDGARGDDPRGTGRMGVVPGGGIEPHGRYRPKGFEF